jgi:preprotein translocase subunit SecD
MLKQFLMIAALSLIVFFACSEPETITLEFRIAEDESAPGLTEMVFSPTGESFYLHNEVLVNESHVDSAFVVMHSGRPAVELLLTAEGTSKFEELTTNNVGKKCGMILDGELVSAPIIRAPITVGRAIIAGDFTEAEVQRIARVLSQQ